MVVAILLLLALLLFPTLHSTRAHAPRTQCHNNLREIGLVFKTWELGSRDDFVMVYSTNNGGTAELIDTGGVFVHFQLMSNELRWPKILVCPDDKEKTVATNLNSGFSDRNISYFIGVDARDPFQKMLLSGDRNLALNNQPLKPGLSAFVTNNPQLSWTKAIHNSCGNILFADGSVEFTDSKSLSLAAQNQAFATNRLAIP